MPAIAVHRQIRKQMLSKTKPFNEYFKDAAMGKLANYTFIEPYYGEIPGLSAVERTDDGHAAPGVSFARAEFLL
jgi:hypothetical protein